MLINQDKVKERLEGVPDTHRSHIYDATIVLEFLVQTFMPTRYFLPPNFSPTPGIQLGQVSMKKVSVGHDMMMRDLYDLYCLFREEKDYTKKIESRYIFGIIIRNLRYYKNGWEFVVYRVGAAQIWHVGPLLMRHEATPEARYDFAVKQQVDTVEGVLVEADPVGDEEEEDPIVGVDPANGEDKTVYVHGHEDSEGTLHITKVSSDRFVEVAEPVVPIQPAPAEDY